MLILLDKVLSNSYSASRQEWQPPFWRCFLKAKDFSKLERSIADEEILAALCSLKPYKAPSLDGLHAGFFQRFWLIVGNSVKSEVKQSFCTGKIPEYLNKTLITFIPKCNSPETLNNYLPISLCNTVYKVITYLIVARLQPALEYLVSPLQTTFMPKRKGVDNTIIVQEHIHSISKKRGREGIMAKFIWIKLMIVLNGALLRTLLLCLSSLATSSPLL